MTARATLLYAARLLECAHDYHVDPVHAKTATQLRALATRLGTEMVLAREMMTDEGWEFDRGKAADEVLCRLDAPLLPEPR